MHRMNNSTQLLQFVQTRVGGYFLQHGQLTSVYITEESDMPYREQPLTAIIPSMQEEAS